MPEGRSTTLDHLGGTVEKADDAATHRRAGLYPGTYLAQWLQPIQ